MSDFETHPVGTIERIKKLEANLSRWNEKGSKALEILEKEPPLSNSDAYLSAELLREMLEETVF